MGWMPDFGYQRNRDSDRDAFKYMKKKQTKKEVGALGKRLDKEIRPMVDVNAKPKGL
jgi:hypothetical protein